MEVAGDWVPKNPPATPMHVLEINLISAQDLKIPSNHFNPKHTYAVAWVHPSHRLRTRLDTIGGENPTWNDKFLFRVSPEFLARETSGVSIEIYSLGRFCDTLVGTVRFLIGNVIAPNDCSTTPSFTAVQVRRPSGRFHGVLNVAVMVNGNSDFASLNGVSAIGYRDLMGESLNRKQRTRSKVWGSETSLDSHDLESSEMSDGSESSSSSACSPSRNPNVLRDLNAIRNNLGGTKTLKPSKSSGFLCGLMMQKKTTMTTPDLPQSEKSFEVSRESPDMER
ncbi:uncharacterized protein LOC101212280 [Cucumis sativus]|uniref:C2 domain-containing protein n=1 Tax=Cucumis sativus TaxID=3659 RepID=A0A0A0L3Y4_CUCSA|nr:uncharacterized protein LOC101212280 [Cucumis sativus]KGN56448.1 hypothetical protein Csa_010337 [Cucumis sativus]